jgi:hemerythrin-like domain-containing protein
MRIAMKPPGPLMIEHRLIERMIKLLDIELERIKVHAEADPYFIQSAVDFFRTYADRTHHGKEEDILFHRLKQKPLSAEHETAMNRLVQEHVWAREAVGKLSAANERCLSGGDQDLSEIIYQMEKLVKFYPQHIVKEDRHFFIPVMDYFSGEEQQAMLEEFWVFDRKMIHEKYAKMIEQREKKMP